MLDTMSIAEEQFSRKLRTLEAGEWVFASERQFHKSAGGKISVQGQKVG